MLVDSSARIWAMRCDETMMADAVRQREALRAGAALASGGILEGSDFARVVDGVAVVPVRGLLLRQMSFWTWSYDEVLHDVALAQADGAVRAIVLDVDSPGGMVSGCSDAARAIRASGPKPIVAFIGGLGTSAAYWLASAADRIVMGSGAIVGSVGTKIEYVDMEPVLERMGARIVRVVAATSPNKRLDPDSPEGQAEMQALVDASGAEFVADVAAFRGLSAAEVLSRFGQGLTFDGAEAIRRGMADARGTTDNLIAELAGRGATQAAPAPAAEETPMDWATITLAGLREHRADIATDIETAAQAAADAGHQAAIAAAVAAERSRIAAIDGIAVTGHEALVAAAKADGRAASQLALDILRAEKAAGGAVLAGLRAADAGAAVPAVSAPAAAETVGGTPEEKAAAAWDKDAALRAEFGDNKGAWLAFSAAQAAGRVRFQRPPAA